MDHLNPTLLRDQARHALNRGRDPKKVVYSYAGILLVVSMLITLADLLLENRISGTGGLSNLGTRAVLSTARQALPMLVSFATMCLELGYLHAMMRISRGQYADHTDLKVGFQHFWPMLRLTLLQSLVYMGLAVLAFQLSYTIFLLTPWAEPLLEMLYPIVESGATTLDEAAINAAAGLLTPMFVLFGIAYLAVWIPFLYWFRMASYCLLDNPRAGALAALRASRKLMRRRFGTMLKIDLSLWPYYLANLGMMLVLWMDMIIPLLGISVPLSPDALYLTAYGCSQMIHFVIQITLRNRAEITYLMAYNAIREKPRDQGVVLGNIFDM